MSTASNWISAGSRGPVFPNGAAHGSSTRRMSKPDALLFETKSILDIPSKGTNIEEPNGLASSELSQLKSGFFP